MLKNYFRKIISANLTSGCNMVYTTFAVRNINQIFFSLLPDTTVRKISCPTSIFGFKFLCSKKYQSIIVILATINTIIVVAGSTT
ncbi:hypothetical protein NIES4071_29190 [Calothrix sp. NIES-4071]|nr:hypothetical protein NIES4071_29190 [Calothrix sp. NIES-4071]BAZ57240.1 hypothetical protein NIES4105_29130 [Calothrix sp. NIES-4105]